MSLRVISCAIRLFRQAFNKIRRAGAEVQGIICLPIGLLRQLCQAEGKELFPFCNPGSGKASEKTPNGGYSAKLV
jgi:hypothetical protein